MPIFIPAAVPPVIKYPIPPFTERVVVLSDPIVAMVARFFVDGSLRRSCHV